MTPGANVIVNSQSIEKSHVRDLKTAGQCISCNGMRFLMEFPPSYLFSSRLCMPMTPSRSTLISLIRKRYIFLSKIFEKQIKAKKAVEHWILTTNMYAKRKHYDGHNKTKKCTHTVRESEESLSSARKKRK